MELVLIAILVVVVLAFIAYPLFSSAEEKPKPTTDALDSLVAQRDSAYDAIRDLDFDFQMGKLSQEDYDKLRDKYKLRAAQVLKQIDDAGGVPDAGANIEQEVARLRHRHVAPASDGDALEAEIARLRHREPSTNGDAIEDEVARLRAQRQTSARIYCSNCGTPARPGDRFCPKCGKKLS